MPTSGAQGAIRKEGAGFPRARCRGPHEAGYTLAELMTVLVVIGIMAAIGVPKLDASRFRVDAAAQTLGSTFLAAQRAAVTRQHNVVVSFDAAAGLVRVHEDADNDGRIDAGENVRFEMLENGVVFGRGGAPAFRIGENPVSFTRSQAGLPAVTFHRNGSTSEEGGFYLTTRRAAQSGGRPGDARLVVIDRATGRASWFEYSESKWTQGF